ncbi:MAG: hypothetical protein QXQ14_02575 [Candidatus Aenigmatarchaeota archaeon]
MNVKNKIEKILRKSKYGLTLREISEKLRISKKTAEKYLYELKGEGKILRKKVGNVIIYYILSLIFIFAISFSQVEIKYFYLNPTQILECIEIGKKSTCTLTNIQNPDSTPERINITGDKPNNYGRIKVSTFNLIPYDINVFNVTAIIRGARCQGNICNLGDYELGDNNNDWCYVDVFENSTTSFNYFNVLPKGANSCQLWNPGTLTNVTLDTTNFFSHIVKLRNSGIVWSGYDSNDNRVWFLIDWMALNVSYFKLLYKNYAFYDYFSNQVLIEPLNVKRGEKFNVSALFEIKDVNVTFIEHNGTGTFIKYFDPVTITNVSTCSYGSQTFNCSFWINYTLDTSNLSRFSKVGPISLRIFANNSFGGYNQTYFKTFYLYGYSKIENIQLNDSYIYPTQSIRASCKIVDANLSIPIQNYPVNFYLNNSLIKTVLTDANGTASIELSFNNEGSYEIKCNITDNATLYYYASENNQASTILKVFNLTAVHSLISNLNFGETQIIKINVTNASAINSIYLNISYTNITDNYELQETYEIKYPILEKCFDNLCLFNLSFIPPRSGNYNVNIYVNASWPFGILKNSSSFFVNFGNANINIVFPNFDNILINQTFLIKVNVSANNGDVWKVNLSLTSSTNSIILNENIFKNILPSIKSNHGLIVEWNVSSLNFGSTNLIFNATPQNGTKYSLTKTFEVIGFNALINSTSINFGNAILYEAKITGNASEIKRVYAVISFFNISNCKLVPTTIIKDLSFYNFSNGYIYRLEFIAPRSGNYSSIIAVETSGTAYNSTDSYIVSFGKAKIEIVNPFYFVLANQTFNLTVKISSENGDIWFLDTYISIYNPLAINLSSSETNYHSNSIEAVANNDYCFDKWLAYSSYSQGNEITTIEIQAFPKNGTSNNYLESFEVILPNKLKAPYVFPNASFIDVNVTIIVPIFGNASEFKINSTIIKPYGSEIEYLNFSFAIAKNYTECGIEVEKGDVASISKNAIVGASGGENLLYSIDDNYQTAYFYASYSNINITFRQVFTINKLTISWSSAGATTYSNISYVDINGNIVKIAENILVNSSQSNITFNFLIPIKTQKIIFKFSNAIALYEVDAYPVEPRLDYCYEFRLVYNNFTRSGNYDVYLDAISSFENVIYLPETSFFINYGIPLLNISEKTYPIMLSGQTQNYTIIVTAYRGDIINLNLTFNSSNQEYINITSSETFEKSIDLLLWKSSAEITWQISARLKGEPNITIQTFVNASCIYCYANNSLEFNITIYPQDVIPPTINDFWFEIRGKNSTIFNLNDSLSIVVNVTDDIFVTKVIAEVIYPENITLNLSLVRGNLWIFTFPEKEKQINQTGNYLVRIFASDLNETYNTVNSSYKNFTVVDIYFLDYEPKYVIFNFGEKIRVFAKDINDFIVEDVKWNETNYNISNVSTFFEINLLNNTFKEGSIILNISAEKYGNKGNITILFNLTKQLLIEIISPPKNYVFKPASKLSWPDFIPSIKVFNVRKDREIDYANAIIYCFNESFIFTAFTFPTFSYNACTFGYNNTYSFENCLSKCYSPNSYGTRFNLTFEVFDSFSNYGKDFIFLFTEELATGSGAGGGGFGGIGGIGAPIPSCRCTEWEPIGCGVLNCGKEFMAYRRSCEPKGCDTEIKCEYSIECVLPVINISYPETISVEKGKNTSFSFILKNTGIKKAFIDVFSYSDCAKIILFESNFSLDVKEERELKTDIRVPLYFDGDECDASFEFLINKEIRIQKPLKMNVEESKLLSILRVLKQDLKKVENILKELQELNLIDKEDEIYKNLIKKYNETDYYIQNDDSINLQKTLAEIEKLQNEIKSLYVKKEIQIFLAKNWLTILIFTLTSLIVYYITFQIGLPILRIQREIYRLSLEEKSLINARYNLQVQFFKRKIAPEMFNKMLMETQQKILTVRGKIATLRKNQKEILIKKIPFLKLFIKL